MNVQFFALFFAIATARLNQSDKIDLNSCVAVILFHYEVFSNIPEYFPLHNSDRRNTFNDYKTRTRDVI